MAAIDALGLSLRALRLAMAIFADAAGTPGPEDEAGKLDEAEELRARWSAAHIVLRAVADVVVREGEAVIGAVKAMLALRMNTNPSPILGGYGSPVTAERFASSQPCTIASRFLRPRAMILGPAGRYPLEV